MERHSFNYYVTVIISHVARQLPKPRQQKFGNYLPTKNLPIPIYQGFGFLGLVPARIPISEKLREKRRKLHEKKAVAKAIALHLETVKKVGSPVKTAKPPTRSP